MPFFGRRVNMKAQEVILKCLIHCLLVGGITTISSCIKIDPPSKPNTIESFQGVMKVRFAIEELAVGAHGVNFPTYVSNATGDRAIIAQMPSASFDIIPKEIFEQLITAVVAAGDKSVGAYEMAASYDLSILSPQQVLESGIVTAPQFAGLLADVDENMMTLTGFEMSNATAKLLDCGIDGSFEFHNGKLFTHETLKIYCDTQSAVDFFGEAPLSILQYDKTGEDITDRDKIILFYVDNHNPQGTSIS